MSQTDPVVIEDQVPSLPRRQFLSGLGLSAGTVLLAPSLGLVSPSAVADQPILAPPSGERRKAARHIREQATQQQYITPNPGHPSNDDERLYADYRANYSKGLPHDALGMVNAEVYRQYLEAIHTGHQQAMEAVPLGGVLKLANPLAAHGFNLIGADPQIARIAAAPGYASRMTALDMVERYWMALCRDIPFYQYASHPLIAEAASDLNQLGWQKTFGFKATPDSLFRARYAGTVDGPYVSQFLHLPVPMGPTTLTQRTRTVLPGQDQLTDLSRWAVVNSGVVNPTGTDTYDPNPYHLRNLRDGANWVHADLPHQCTSYAAQLLWSWGPDFWSDANPYKSSITKASPFTTCGLPDILSLITLASNYALRFAWYQKWCVHRRVRPEVFAQRVHRSQTEGIDLGIAPVLFESAVLDQIYQHNREQNIKQGLSNEGTYLLPMVYPEGCPPHPAYPAGHATTVAAGVTICKAFFNEAAIIPKPMVPDEAGTELDTYPSDLSVGGELNKLIANVSLFRDAAGMHWRTDGVFNPSAGYDTRFGGNVLGEAVALAILRDVRLAYPETFTTPFRITRLDGTVAEIG
ncbi:MAG: hypothetical protein ACR2HF_10120 [Methylococcaceae bacterium]